MKAEIFELERFQSLYENLVDYNLTESGVHPYSLRELLTPDQLETLLDLRLTYGQTNGLPELRAQIAALYPSLGEDNVLVTNGSSEANFIACLTCLEPGDRVAMMLPNYMQMDGIAKMLGVEVCHFRLREDNNWRPDLQQLKEIAGNGVKMIIICNPNNPTGSRLSQEDMREIVAIAASAGAWIYSDEVYRGAELDGVETESFSGMYEKTLVSCGLSKAYALPGLRLGWLAGPASVIEQAWAASDYTSITASVFSNQVAIWALEPAKRAQIFERNRSLLRHNLQCFANWCATGGHRFRFIPPKAGGFAFCRYDYPVGATELVDRLRQEYSTFVVSGAWFGFQNYLRIGLGSETEYLEKALARMTEALDKFYGRSGA